MAKVPVFREVADEVSKRIVALEAAIISEGIAQEAKLEGHGMKLYLTREQSPNFTLWMVNESDGLLKQVQRAPLRMKLKVLEHAAYIVAELRAQAEGMRNECQEAVRKFDELASAGFPPITPTPNA